MHNNTIYSEKRIMSSAMKKFLYVVTIMTLILVLCPITHAEVQTVEVGIPVEEHPELFLTRSMPTHGEGKIAVFLIDFPDYRNDNPLATVEYYDGLYFSGGVETSWGDTTVADFYEQESYGKLKLSGQVFDWYTAKHHRSYYDNKKAELIMEVAEYYRAAGMDFSEFDGDNDGMIDAIAYHFAGKVTSVRNSSWYGGVMYANSSGHGTIDGLNFKTMVQLPNAAGTKDLITTICHELMHTLGMPDLYSEMSFVTFPTTDLMAQNENTINPYLKIMLGWVDVVQVITENTENIRLDTYGRESAGGVAIVTDKYTGLFDEFYLVAYRYFEPYPYKPITTAVIWHIDARLTEDGMAFQYQNLYYDPCPDKNPHNKGDYSAVPFIEELSADANFDFVLNNNLQWPAALDRSAFGENSILGPNSIPSSDTHDGRYTGIQIHNFVEHDEKYLTFDVSFVEDNIPPLVTTDKEDLGLKGTIKIHFSEHIYISDNWGDIQVLDLNGEPINVTIKRSNYPCNEVEIIFADDSYKNGYQILLPEACLRDSSGNNVAQITLTSDFMRAELFPISQKELPDSGKYLRNNSGAFFFPHEEDIVVITEMTNNKFEFMRLDRDGNILVQTFVDKPYDRPFSTVVETGDGCYIVFIPNKNGEADRIFCIDKNGDLRWVNDDCYNTGTSFSLSTFSLCENGLIVLRRMNNLRTEWVCILSDTGDTQIVENTIATGFVLSNGILKSYIGSYVGHSGNDTILRLMDIENNQVKAEGILKGSEEKRWILDRVHDNCDGTILVHCFNYNGDTKVFLLDAELNVVKSVQLTNTKLTKQRCFYWFENDGFYEVVRTENGNHSNSKYLVNRYDRYLNKIWQANVEANFIYYFESSSGELMAYKSMYDPNRACYIEYYGKEDTYKTEHIHHLVHVKTISATCISEGCGEYWYCTDCGCRYFDEGQTPVLDIQTLILPVTEHTEEIISEVSATCTTDGLTEGIKCAVCEEVITAQEIVPALGHVYGEWVTTEAATCTEVGKERCECDRCDHFETREIAPTGHSYKAVVTAPTCTEQGYTTYTCYCGDSYVDSYVNALGHKFGEWTQTKVPTCTETGLERRDCERCNYVETREIAPVGHRYKGVVRNPTCTEQGYTTHTCHCGDSYVDSYVAALGHSFGAWIEIKAPTCTELGEERKDCEACKHFETQEIAALGHDRVPHAAKDATCTEIGWNAYETCFRCDYTTCVEIPATGHSHNAVVTAPTCTEQGHTTHTCHCGDEYVDSYVDALGHNYDEWIETKAHTCTEIGEECRDCKACDHFETREVEALGHDAIKHSAQSATCTEIGWNAYVTCSRCDYTTYAEILARGHEHHCSVTAPTCTEKGFTTHTCACGDSYIGSYVDAYGHDLGERMLTKAPTCTGVGEERRECGRCDYFEARELPIVDHADDDANGTCDMCGKQMSSDEEPSGSCLSVLTISSYSVLMLAAFSFLAVLKKKKD